MKIRALRGPRRLSQGSHCPRPYAGAVTDIGSQFESSAMAAENQGKKDGSAFAPLRRMISAERFSTYMAAAGHDEERALLLYLWNAQLGEAFHLPIQAVEVGLRNCVDQALQLEFGTTWWGDGDFRTLVDRQQIEAIDVALHGIARRGDSPTHGGMVSGLSFGFWVAMLKPRYNPRFWSRRLRNAFPHLPRAEDRRSLEQRLQAIRILRNRIAHHEPIIRRDTSKDYAELMTTLRWMSPAMHD